MKKKFRNIIVDNQIYAWSVVINDEGLMIKIWKNKKLYKQKYLYNHNEIKPSQIQELITKNN